MSAILILPVVFAPLTSFHALKCGAGYLESFSSFNSYLSCQVHPYYLLLPKNFLLPRIVSPVGFSSAIQACNQSIDTKRTFSVAVSIDNHKSDGLEFSFKTVVKNNSFYGHGNRTTRTLESFKMTNAQLFLELLVCIHR